MKIQTAERNSGQESSDNVIHHRHMIAYRESAKIISGRVLEIGSGEGYGLRILSPKCDEYYAVDKHPTPINEFSGRITFFQMIVPPFVGLETNSFDFVVSFQVIEHIKDHLLFLKEVYRVLKPGGKLILSTPNIELSLSRNPWHIREYTLTEMDKLLKTCFDVFEIQGVYGNEKVMDYHEKNRLSVKRITRWDIFRLQYNLPRWMLRIPYDLANRMNRKKLAADNTGLVNEVTTDDFFIKKADTGCFDFFCIATKF